MPPPRYYFKFGYLAVLFEIYFIAACFFSIELPYTTSLRQSFLLRLYCSLIPLFLTILSRFAEGWSGSTLPAIACSLFIIGGAASSGMTRFVLTILSVLAAIAHTVMTFTFVIKQPFRPTGRFKVGYRISENYPDYRYAVYYPTLRQRARNPTYINDNQGWMRLIRNSQNFKKQPARWRFESTVHFFRKVPIPAGVNSPLVSLEQLKEYTGRDKFVPVIICPSAGIGAQGYASIACQLASQGHIVFSMEHFEEVMKMKYHPEIAKASLKTRTTVLKQLIAEMKNPKESLTKLFEGSKLDFNLESLVVIGHVDGGATVFNLCVEEPSINSCILLDPMFRTLEEKSFNSKINANLFVLESEGWNPQHAKTEITDKNLKILDNQKGNKKGALYCKAPKTQNLTFCDHHLIAGGMLVSNGSITDLDYSEDVYELVVKMVEEYVSVVAMKDQTMSEENHQNFLSLFADDERLVFNYKRA